MIRAPRWVPYPGIHKARHARDRLHQVLDPLIIEAKRNPGRRDDLLSLLMNATDPKTNKLMNTTDVRYNLLTFITAGHETTALALTWTFYLLSLHPEVERRVTSEIAGATAGRPVCADHLETARRCFVRSLRTNPLFVKSWIGVALSLLPFAARRLKFLFRSSMQQHNDLTLPRPVTP